MTVLTGTYSLTQPASITLAASLFQRSVRDGDLDAQAAIQRSWLVADAAVTERINEYLAKLAAAQKAGTPVSESWAYQVGRLDQVRAYTAAQYTQLGIALERQVATAQLDGISTGMDGTQRLMELGLAGVGAPRIDFAHLDAQAEFSRMVGRLQTGSPLRDLTFSNLSVAGAESVAKALLAGTLAGESTRNIARRVALEKNMTLARAHTIARTEILRGAREASLLTMQANAKLLKGWRWSAHLDSRTCGTCIANQGQLYPTGTPFITHPNCRCAPVPQTKSWDELGYPGVKSSDIGEHIPKANDWLAQMSAADLRRAFGPTRADLIRGGYLTAGDLTRLVDRGRWGKQPTLATVAQLKTLAAARGWTPPPPPTPKAAPPPPTVGTTAPSRPLAPKPPPTTTIGGALRFSNNAAATDWGRVNYRDTRPSAQQKAALSKYTGGGYVEINSAARGRYRQGLLELTKAQAMTYAGHLDALLRRRLTPDAVVVYRGTTGKAFVVPGARINRRGGSIPVVGTTYSDGGFLSTSLTQQAAFSGKPYMLELTVPAGTPAYWTMPYSHYRGEMELTLGRGTQFVVTAIEPMGGTQYLVKAKVVAP